MFNLFKTKEEAVDKKKVVEGKLLSVIMPVYNHEKYVAEAIESVLEQTYASLELIIIDDGSKDNSLKVCRNYTSDSRVTVLSQENAGAHNTINRGLELAKGQYLAIINSDDIYEKDRFELMIAEMEKDKDLGFMCSYIRVINQNGKDLGVKEGWKNMEPWLLEHPEKSLASEGFVGNLIISNFTSTTSNFLFTRELYQKIGGMRNLRFAHDWDFALRTAKVTKCKILERPLMKYRVHDSNTISSDRKWMLFEIAWMWAVHLADFSDLESLNVEDKYEYLFRAIESVNLQGNDKVFWMLLMFMKLQKDSGIVNPEELLLDDGQLRRRFIDYIVE